MGEHMGTHPIFESDFDCLTEQKNMEFVIGIKGKDFVLIGADQSAMRSIIVYQQELDKIHKIGKKTAMAVCGEVGDTNFFTESISKNIALYEIRNGYGMSPDEAAAYTRQYLAQSMRSRKSYQVNLLLAGYDDIEEEPRLHMLDYLGSDIECPYGSHGYGAMFTMSILDRHYNRSCPPTREEAIKLYQACADELQRRFMVNLPLFMSSKSPMYPSWPCSTARRSDRDH